VFGPNEAQVLGIAGVIDRYVQRVEPGVGTVSQTEARPSSPHRRTQEATHEPLYRQGWFWGAVGAALALAGIIVAVVVAS
jgi:hypothetical protein